jgi:hypothetical protein
MPHRLVHLNFATIGEALALITAAVIANINSLIDETSWDRLTGRHGALFFMAVALLIFWNSNRMREKREAARLVKQEAKEDARREDEEELRQIENEAREQRHREAMALQQANSQRLMELTVEGIKAQGLVAQSLHRLSDTLDGRPCGVAALRREQEQAAMIAQTIDQITS